MRMIVFSHEVLIKIRLFDIKKHKNLPIFMKTGFGQSIKNAVLSISHFEKMVVLVTHIMTSESRTSEIYSFGNFLKKKKVILNKRIQMPDGISNSAIKFLITQSKVHVSIDPL
jgi:hypothetical protein